MYLNGRPTTCLWRRPCSSTNRAHAGLPSVDSSRSVEPAHQQQPVLDPGGRSPAADAGGARRGPDGGRGAVRVPRAERHRGPAVRRPHADGHVPVLAHVCGNAHSRAGAGSVAQADARRNPVRLTPVGTTSHGQHRDRPVNVSSPGVWRHAATGSWCCVRMRSSRSTSWTVQRAPCLARYTAFLRRPGSSRTD